FGTGCWSLRGESRGHSTPPPLLEEQSDSSVGSQVQ
ncbi:hypothetical protein LEMLEM_LOCUS3652, partial [Lemmus lemmus]